MAGQGGAERARAAGDQDGVGEGAHAVVAGRGAAQARHAERPVADDHLGFPRGGRRFGAVAVLDEKQDPAGLLGLRGPHQAAHGALPRVVGAVGAHDQAGRVARGEALEHVERLGGRGPAQVSGQGGGRAGGRGGWEGDFDDLEQRPPRDGARGRHRSGDTPDRHDRVARAVDRQERRGPAHPQRGRPGGVQDDVGAAGGVRQQRLPERGVQAEPVGLRAVGQHELRA